jgi:hypothetical protein
MVIVEIHCLFASINYRTVEGALIQGIVPALGDCCEMV